MKAAWITLIAVAAIAGFLVGRTSVEAGKNSIDSDVQSDASAPQLPASQPTDFTPKTPLADIDPDSATESYRSQQIAERLQYGQLRDVAARNYPAAQKELQAWSHIHKAELYAKMKSVLGDRSDVMFELVLSGNAMINEPLAQQPIEQDITWRKQARASLEYFILTHVDDPHFDVLDIVCMQKKCEVTFSGKDIGESTAVSKALIADKPSGVKTVSDLRKTIFQDPNYWAYMIVHY